MKTRWNLDLARDTLHRIAQPDWIARVNQQLTELESKVAGREREFVLTQKAKETMNTIQVIDHQLDTAQALVSLLETSGETSATPPALNELTLRFILCIDTIYGYLNLHPEILTSPILEWYRSLPSELPDASLAKSFQHIANAYLNGFNPEQLLLSRIKTDPEMLALRHRLQEEGLSSAPRFSEQHQEESQNYWSKLLDGAGRENASSYQAREFESQGYERTSWSLDQAIDTLCHALEGLHPSARVAIQALSSEGRLHLTETDQDNDLCLDTPLGSFVRVYFDGGIECLLRLAHETGHAIQQSVSRRSQDALQALSPLDSEVWAIKAEKMLLDYLERQGDTEEASRLLRKSRSIELDHRHRMLHSFEFDLHNPSIDSKQKIIDLWLAKNKCFYGNRVHFEADFHDSWTEIHHLYTAPFYLMIYPVAHQKATTSTTLPGLFQGFQREWK